MLAFLGCCYNVSKTRPQNSKNGFSHSHGGQKPEIRVLPGPHSLCKAESWSFLHFPALNHPLSLEYRCIFPAPAFPGVLSCACVFSNGLGPPVAH